MAGKPRKTVTDKTETASLHLMMMLFTCALIATGSLSVLQNHAWVEPQKLWLISRSAALTAFLVLTFLIGIGVVMSHPLNKTKWQLTPRLLSWHQALTHTFLSLICIHLVFSAADRKSGISWLDLLLPVHAKYHVWAMILGALALYLFMLTALTATLRKWFNRFWLPIHRFSILIWILVFLHGIFGGTDAREYAWMYYGTGLFLLALFLWRQSSGVSAKKPSGFWMSNHQSPKE